MIWTALKPRPALSRPLRALFDAAGARLPSRSEVRAITAAPDVHPQIAAEAERLLGEPAAFPSFADHQAINRAGGAAARLAFYAASRLLAPDSFAARARLHAALPATDSPLDALQVDRRTGVLVTDQSAWPVVAAAVEEARERFAVTARSGAVNPGKLFMTTAKLPDALDSRIMVFGRHPATLRLVGRYLEGLPILYRINLLDSANDVLQEGSSQFFHIDPEDFRQLKIFLLVDDVDADAGPLHLLSADASDAVRVARRHGHGRIADDEVMSIAPPEALTPCTGPAGALAIGDTSRCFHFGSRPGRRRRYVVMYQYLTPFASAFAIDARAVASKYADVVRARMTESGAPADETEAYLFGLRR